jgi:hypothetical protein
MKNYILVHEGYLLVSTQESCTRERPVTPKMKTKWLMVWSFYFVEGIVSKFDKKTYAAAALKNVFELITELTKLLLLEKSISEGAQYVTFRRRHWKGFIMTINISDF